MNYSYNLKKKFIFKRKFAKPYLFDLSAHKVSKLPLSP